MSKAQAPRECFATYYEMVSGGQFFHAHGLGSKRKCCEKAEWIHVIEKSAYDAQAARIAELERKLEIAKKQLERCRGAMAYAYEDCRDQYYLNVAENIIETIAQIEELKK